MNEDIMCQDLIKYYINKYHHIRVNQLRRIAKYYGLQNAFSASISRLNNSGLYQVKNNAITFREQRNIFDLGNHTSEELHICGLEKSFVIFTDFLLSMPLIEHFPTCRFPFVMVFATKTTVYELLYVAYGMEKTAADILLHKDMDYEISDSSRRIVIVDREDQISNIKLDNVFSFAVVDEAKGEVLYYPTQTNERSEFMK